MSESVGHQAVPAPKQASESVKIEEAPLQDQHGSLKAAGLFTLPLPPKPPQVLHLQRLIGNQATIRHVAESRARLQRDLNREQLEAARTHYAAHADDYPVVLVRRVQAALEVTPTDLINDATIEAIARYQTSGGRVCTPSETGIMTREQMVDMVAVGLERRSERSAYVEGVGELSTRWASLSPEERLSEVARLGNARLTSIHVPEIEFVSSVDITSICHTSPDTWQVLVNAQILANDILPLETISTVYHEMRHAEQYWLAQRYDVQTHRLIESITLETRLPILNDWGGTDLLPDDIVALARSSPVLVGDERQLARMMHHRFFEDTSSISTDFLIPLQEANCEAQDRQRADPTPEHLAEVERTSRAFAIGRQTYANWWHESDTGLIGDLIGDEYSAEHPDVPRTPAVDVCE